MKKTQKKVLGFLGLSLVAGLTVAAATIPTPEASAISDVLTVRVVGNKPDVNFNVTMPSAVSSQSYWLELYYEQIGQLTLKLEHVGSGTYLLGTIDADYGSDTLKQQLLLNNYGGYGEYVATATGTGVNGGDEDNWAFAFYPVIIEQQENGDYTVETNEDDPTIDKVVVTITGTGTDANGNPQEVNKTIEIKNDDDLNKALEELTKGEYTVTVTAYDEDGNVIYKPYVFHYTSTKVPDAGAPDTGGLFQNLNIAKEDYLITGLIVFFVIGVVAFAIVAKGRQTQKTRKRR